MRIALNSLEHQRASGYVYKLLASAHPHDQLVLHFILCGSSGNVQERVDLVSTPPTVEGKADARDFAETDQARFEEWFTRNADILIDAYRSACIFDYEQAFD